MFISKLNSIYFRKNFVQNIRKFETVAHNQNIIKSTDEEHQILNEIKSAKDSNSLLNILANKKLLTSKNALEGIKALFILQKTGNSTLESSQIINMPGFELICKRLKTASRSMDVGTVVDTLKNLSYMGVPANSEITYILLNHLRKQINDVTLNQLTFLDFLLRKFDKTPLVEALQFALPMVFQIQLTKQIDHENVPELVDLLSYSSRNTVSDSCIMSIVTGLTLHGTNLTVDEARSIMWSLSSLSNFKQSYERLLENVFNVLIKNSQLLEYELLDTTLTKVVDKVNDKVMQFYNEDFFNKCASLAIEKNFDFIKCVYFLKKFNKINFVNVLFLDYIIEKCTINPKLISEVRPNIYLTLITGLSTANYKPKQLNLLKSYILQNSVLQSNNVSQYPWMKLCNELMSLNCFDKNLLEKIFADSFLEKFLSRDNNTLDYLQFLSLYQNTAIIYTDYDGKMPSKRFIEEATEINLNRNTFPLKASLEHIFGGENFVATKLTSNYGHCIDHCILFDRNNNAIEITERDSSDIITVENLQSPNVQIVALLVFPKTYYVQNFPRLKGMFELRVLTIETLGIHVVPINIDQWIQIPDREKLPYLEREIRCKLIS